jgi:hypothetical protein
MSSITLMFIKVLIDVSGGDCFGAKYEKTRICFSRIFNENFGGQEKRFKFLPIRIKQDEVGRGCVENAKNTLL